MTNPLETVVGWAGPILAAIAASAVITGLLGGKIGEFILVFVGLWLGFLLVTRT